MHHYAKVLREKILGLLNFIPKISGDAKTTAMKMVEMSKTPGIKSLMPDLAQRVFSYWPV
jgi:hypothetical protein